MTKGRENVASEAKSEGLVFHPMDQFIVKPFFGEGPVEFYTFTNVAFWMVAAIVAVIAIMVLGHITPCGCPVTFAINCRAGVWFCLQNG